MQQLVDILSLCIFRVMDDVKFFGKSAVFGLLWLCERIVDKLLLVLFEGLKLRYDVVW